MLDILIGIVQKLGKLLGYNIIISRNKINTNSLNNVRLHQKNIKDLKIVLNREMLLKYLPKNSIVAELGVDKGDFSNKIISLTQPKKIFLIDSWDSDRLSKDKMNYVEKRFKKKIDDKTVIVIRGRSEIELQKFENGFFDWVYIDTNHTYRQTAKELEICRLKVKDGGIIAGHDYCQGNINKSLAYGVVLAVNQFCIKYDWRFVYLTHETDRCLSFAIIKID